MKTYIYADVFFFLNFNLSREYTVFTEGPEFARFLLVVNDKMTAVSGRFSPALINAVYGVVSVDTFLKGIDFNVSFSFIAVRIDDEIGFSCLLVGKAENCRP